MLNNAETVLRFGNAGPHIAAAFITFAFQYGAFNQKFSSFFPAFFNRVEIHFNGILIGGAFLVLADALARTMVSPAELPIGVLTALVGGPFFLWLLASRAVRGGL